MNWLLKLASGIDKLSEAVGKLVSWLTTILVLLVVYYIIVRELFKGAGTWITELEWHLFALIFLLGAGYTLKHDRHVRVDLFYAKFSERDKAWVNFIGTLVFLIPWCLLVIYTSYHYAMESFIIKETSPDPGGLPARYVIKFAVTVGIGFLLLQAISNLIKALAVINAPKITDDLTQNKPNE